MNNIRDIARERQISEELSSRFDVDFMDIRRRIGSGNPQEIRPNVPCHITLRTPDTVDTSIPTVTPITSVMIVNFDDSIDVRTGDYLILKRRSANNRLKVWGGECSLPYVNVIGRKEVQMSMNTLQELDDYTPIPPENPYVITVRYTDIDKEPFLPNVEYKIEQGGDVIIQPMIIGGYKLDAVFLDGIFQPEAEIITLNNVQSDHEVHFIYEQDLNAMPTEFRLLMDGLFELKNGNFMTGSFATGTGTLHLMPFNGENNILLLSGLNGNYTITTSSNTARHNVTSQQPPIKRLQIGSILKLFDTMEWVKLINDPIQISDGWQFDTEPYIPSEHELNAMLSL